MLTISIIVYLLGTLTVGYFAGKLVKGSKDFILAGRSLPLFLSASALFATWFGSETILGASSEFAKHGFPGIIEDPFGGALCLILFGVFFARPLYKMNLLTIGDLFKQKYGRKTELLAAVFLVPSYFSWITAQLVALGILLNTITGLDVFTGMILSAIIVTTYTTFGGMWAVSITDFIQSIIIVVGLLTLSVLLYRSSDGLNSTILETPQGFFNLLPEEWSFDGIMLYFTAWITIGLGSIPSQDIFQRAMSAKNADTASRSSILGGILYLFIAMLPLYIILAGRSIYPDTINGDSIQQALPTIVMNHSPVLVQILFLGALLSAIMSTTSAAILAPASVLSENLLKPLLKDKFTDKQFLILLRLCVVVIALVATLMGKFRTNIYELVGESSALTLVSLFIPMCAAIYHKNTSKGAAIWSMLTGMAVWMICTIMETDTPAALAGLVASLSAYILAHLALKK